jgi:hypothetical protein
VRQHAGWGVSRTTARKWLDQGRLPEFAEPIEVPGVPPRATPGTSRWHPLRIAGGLILAGVALAMAWYGMRIDQWYGASLGKTEEASTLLACLSVCADTPLVLPSSALALWADGRRTVAGAAWAVWGVVLVVTLLASVGFASINIADTTAAGARVADQGAGLTDRIGRLRIERAALVETRSVASLEAELQRAQPAARAVWKATARCTVARTDRIGRLRIERREPTKQPPAAVS